MYNKDLLITDTLPPLDTTLLNSIRKDYFEQSQKDCKDIEYKDFIIKAESTFKSNLQNKLVGFEAFPYKDVIIGCQHYIDNLISKDTGLPVVIADDPLSCVALGTGKALDQEETFSTLLVGH